MTALPYPLPSAQNDWLITHIHLLCDSLYKLTGRHLVEPGLSAIDAARYVYHAPFVVLSHNTDFDPVLTYANLAGQQLFEMNWETLTTTPSRRTAEALLREERDQLLQRVSQCGFIDDYAGVRVSATGRRFRIERAMVWNLGDANVYKGQAATFSDWTWL